VREKALVEAPFPLVYLRFCVPVVYFTDFYILPPRSLSAPC